VAYTQVTDSEGHVIKGGDNDSIHTQVIPESVADEAKRILETVVSSGTGTNADIGAEGQWGKTGTTENNGDAWFCGGVSDVTACVWVGYADTTTPMTTLYNGGPVMGGTFPALIWASVISSWEEISKERAAERASHRKHGSSESGSEYTPTAPSTGSEEEVEVEPEGEVEAEPSEAPEAAEGPEAAEAQEPAEPAPEEAEAAPAEPAEPAEPAAPAEEAGGGVTAG
jgi:penicillin-binding protein 1A